jgi:hypothetical protein
MVPIPSAIKKFVIRVLEQRGYILLKKEKYTELKAFSAVAATEPGLPSSVVPLTETTPLLPNQFDDVTTPSLQADFQRFRKILSARSDVPTARAHALYAALRYLTHAKIPGVIMDCGDGTPHTLEVIATALTTLGDVSRSLVLFDVTCDPTHRAETELQLWGSNRCPFLDAKLWQQPARDGPGPLPKALVSTGYPIAKMEVVRLPVDSIDLVRPIGFLNLTSETYELNRAAIRALVPQVVTGGVVAVEGHRGPRPGQPGCVQHQIDAVADLLAKKNIALPFSQVTDTYRIGVKP